MTAETIVQYALEAGFAAAKTVETHAIVFNPDFRKYCEENLCGQYGANHACPPGCGSPEAMKQKMLSHPKALVLQSRWDIGGHSDLPAILRAKQAHHTAELGLVRQLRALGCDGFLVGASGCALCNPCAAQQGKPCPFPEERYSCMSAYCVAVKELAELCEMDYSWDPGTLLFFSMYVYD